MDSGFHFIFFLHQLVQETVNIKAIFQFHQLWKKIS